MNIIDGKALASKINDQNIAEILKLNNLKDSKDLKKTTINQRPNLAIILIGQRPDSKLYVNLKEKKAVEIGVDTHLYKCDGKESETEIIEMIKFLNSDSKIDGILIQVPLPPKYNTDKIIATINPAKDVDCFHPNNYPKKNKCPRIISPVYASVLEIIKATKLDTKNKKAVILANSKIFGEGLKNILECKDIKSEVAYVTNKNWEEKCAKADILITAIGKKHIIKEKHIKKDSLLIDIGISKVDNKVYGDIDLESVKDKAFATTPVPGGIGPLTIAQLFKNLIIMHKKKLTIS